MSSIDLVIVCLSKHAEKIEDYLMKERGFPPNSGEGQDRKAMPRSGQRLKSLL
jgi:hypothetical protein